VTGFQQVSNALGLRFYSVAAGRGENAELPLMSTQETGGFVGEWERERAGAHGVGGEE
jgi:hypothetical protein